MNTRTVESWELRERRPRFWGSAGEALRSKASPAPPQKRVARQRTQYAVNFFLTYLLTDLLTTELIFRRHFIEIGQLTHFWTPWQ